jgi:hypothetical protein
VPDDSARSRPWLDRVPTVEEVLSGADSLREDPGRAVDRLVDRDAYHRDPLYHAQVHWMKHLIRLVDVVLTDEEVSPEVRRKVATAISYGTPNPVNTHERIGEWPAPWPGGGRSPSAVQCRTCLVDYGKLCIGVPEGLWHLSRIRDAAGHS